MKRSSLWYLPGSSLYSIIHSCVASLFVFLDSYFISLRTSDIHLFYNLQLFYWHFLEILWLFIFLILYHYSYAHLQGPNFWMKKKPKKRRKGAQGLTVRPLTINKSQSRYSFVYLLFILFCIFLVKANALIIVHFLLEL